MAHPHLSQALLGTPSSTTVPSAGCSKDSQATLTTPMATVQPTNTSLIKSLLATKVNECMTTVSMKTADCQSVVQVTQLTNH